MKFAGASLFTRLSRTADAEAWQVVWRGRKAFLKRVRLAATLRVDGERHGLALQKSLRADARVPEVLDEGTSGEWYYYVTEWVEGMDLAEAIAQAKGSRLPERRALTIAIELCNSASRWRDSGGKPVHHCDLHPRNIRIDDKGKVHICDFGCAVSCLPGRSCRTSYRTPGYCSPERLATDLVDGRADAWAIAVTLYEMVEGRRPFEELTGAPDFHRRVPHLHLSSALRGILERALFADVSARFADAEALAGELRGLPHDAPAAGQETTQSGNAGVPPLTVRTGWSRRAAFACFFGLVMLAALAAAPSQVQRWLAEQKVRTAESKYKAGSYREALALYRDAARIDPSWRLPWFRIGTISSYKTIDPASAEQAIAKAVKLGYPKRDDATAIVADAYYNRAILTRSRARQEQRAADFAKALSLYRQIPGFGEAPRRIPQCEKESEKWKRRPGTKSRP